ncbi:MAG: acyl-CoA thioesterase [Bacteroidales bacterium]|nr:acyl-CoA thioesterase [Bacteroidales bacterium]
MLTCEVEIRVRYGEVDRMGYLHHGNYPLYLEVGRTELIRQLGLSYKTMEDRGVLLPVRDICINYKQAALYDDLVIVKTVMKEKPMVKLAFDYTIHNTGGDLLCDAHTTLVFVDAISRKPIKAPEFFNQLIAPYFPGSAQ